MVTPAERAAINLTAPGERTILFIGHSFTEGAACGYNGLGYFDVMYDWWGQAMTATLQRAFKKRNGGVGYVNGGLSTLYPISALPTRALYGPVGFLASANTGTFSATEGRAIGARTYVPSADETTTITAQCSSLGLHYAQGTSSYGDISVAIDGGTPIVISPDVASGLRYNGYYKLPTLAYGEHTFVCTPAAGKKAQICGVKHYANDENNCIHAIMDSHGGWGTNDAITSNNMVYSAGDYSKGLTNLFSLWPNPDLICIMYMTNNWGYSVAQRTAAQTTTDLQAIIASLYAGTSNSPPVMLAIEFEAGATLFGTTELEPWANYVAAANAVVAADPNNVFAVDMASVIVKPTVGNNYSGGLVDTDLIHPNSNGQRLIGRTAAQAITAFAPGGLSAAPSTVRMGSAARPHSFQPGIAR